MFDINNWSGSDAMQRIVWKLLEGNVCYSNIKGDFDRKRTLLLWNAFSKVSSPIGFIYLVYLFTSFLIVEYLYEYIN